MQNIVAAFY